MNSSGSAEGAAIVVLLSLALVRHRRSMGIEETVTVIHDRNPSHGASPNGIILWLPVVHDPLDKHRMCRYRQERVLTLLGG
jgi:hypothetical protein